MNNDLDEHILRQLGGVDNNNFLNKGFIGIEDDTGNSLIRHSSYFDAEHFKELFKNKQNCVTVLSTNVASITSKMDELRIFFNYLKWIKFSDHQPYFTSLELVRTYQTTPKYIRVYDESEDSLEKFSEEFNLTNFSTVLDKSPSADPTLNYNILEDILCKLKNKHFQSKFVKFNKYKHKKSPWITTSILRSVKFRNQLYKQFRKAPVNSEEACTLRTNLKTYNGIIKKVYNKGQI